LYGFQRLLCRPCLWFIGFLYSFRSCIRSFGFCGVMCYLGLQNILHFSWFFGWFTLARHDILLARNWTDRTRAVCPFHRPVEPSTRQILHLPRHSSRTTNRRDPETDFNI
jgi:hypothetical protein